MKSIRNLPLTYFLLYGFLLLSCTFIQVPNALENTSWELLSFLGEQPMFGKQITLTFANGLVKGTAGCNSYQGEYRVRGDKIEIDTIFSTMMACPEPEGIILQEQKFLEYLREAISFQVTEDQLYLYGGGGEEAIFTMME
jgi:heat shock protein HslJ